MGNGHAEGGGSTRGGEGWGAREDQTLFLAVVVTSLRYTREAAAFRRYAQAACMGVEMGVGLGLCPGSLHGGGDGVGVGVG